MNQHKNEDRNPQNEDRSNQRTNQERGRNDLNPTDRSEKETEREFDLEDDKKRNLEVTSKKENPGKDRDMDKKNQDRSVPRHEDPNVNADSENRMEKTGTMRNRPEADRVPAEE
jgi:hypothetical protein